jgi:uncharacterized protein (DUF1697 family)
MKYIALLRGINVGKSLRIDMRSLKTLFESLGYECVSTYINSGNIIFNSIENRESIMKKITDSINKEFNAEIPILIKTEQEMKAIAAAIPVNWQNDSTHKTDVAYLFPQIDSPETIDELPVKREFLDIRYISGAIFWNVDRNDYNKSHLNKIVSHRYYPLMTVRNVTTARFLAGMK